MGRWGDGEIGRSGDGGVTHHRVKLLPLASCLLPLASCLLPLAFCLLPTP
ncbi:hypothetical protein [Moorena producens]|nr:hypothetical protein [Moorena producens]